MRWRWILVAFSWGSALAPLSAQNPESLISPGPLSRAHRELTGLSNCTACHVPGEGAAPVRCLECHRTLAARISAGRGLHRFRSDDCTACHAEHNGVEFQLIRWQPESFQHALTGYPLVGLHSQVEDCRQCHQPERAPDDALKTDTFLLADTQCVSCHEDVHKGQLGADCRRCHSLDQPFDDVAFDHSSTAFPLRGAHSRVDCAGCHTNGRWKGLSFGACTSCHEDAHVPSLGPDCTGCHTENNWKVGRRTRIFDHDRTAFPLLGRHESIDCRSCHADLQFHDLSFGRCRDCHTSDPHRGQFQTDCRSCHQVTGFSPSTFDHAGSRYPLQGNHLEVECGDCHKEEEASFPSGFGSAIRYRPVSDECAGCHTDAHLGQFEKPCQDCHDVRREWDHPVGFDHDRDSGFRLLGRHLALDCASCHLQETGQFPKGDGTAVRFQPVASECVACHPDYHSGQLASDCGQCHDSTAFRPAAFFDHSAAAFRLDGAHQELECAQCHPQVSAGPAAASASIPRYRPVETECAACHGEPHRSRSVRDCTRCHSTAEFAVEDFDHDRTVFPLTGRHREVDCRSCHPPASTLAESRIMTFRARPAGCIDCHSSPHRSRYRECVSCHTTDSWRVGE